MKNLFVSILLLSSLMLGFNMEAKDAKKVLVVYYSWGGNTRNMANTIKSALNCDIAEISPVNAYPTDYRKCVDQAKKETKAKVHPAIKPLNVKVTNYDVIFVGSPNWWSTIAPPVATFLAGNNLAGKTIIPFVTHGGGGFANCVIDMKALCKGAKVLDGKEVYGDAVTKSKAEIEKWAKGLPVVK